MTTKIETISGRVEKFEVVDSSFLTVILGNSATLFHLVLDDPYKVSAGRALDRIPVRLESGIRIPNIEGSAAKVAGSYNSVDGFFDANQLAIDKLNFTAFGIRRYALWLAITIIVLYAWLAPLLITSLFIEFSGGFVMKLFDLGEICMESLSHYDDGVPPTCLILGGLAGLIVILAKAVSIAFTILGWFVTRVAVSRVLQALHHFVRRLTEYA